MPDTVVCEAFGEDKKKPKQNMPFRPGKSAVKIHITAAEASRKSRGYHTRYGRVLLIALERRRRW